VNTALLKDYKDRGAVLKKFIAGLAWVLETNNVSRALSNVADQLISKNKEHFRGFYP
jgi:hypothetical protein